MSDVSIFKGLRVQDVNGEILINLEDVARGLGFTYVSRHRTTVVRWNRVNEYLSDWGVATSGDPDTMISESMFYLLAMKAKNETAKSFQIKVATEIIPAYRKSLATHKLPQTYLEALKELVVVKEKEAKANLQLKEASDTIEQNKPKVAFAESMESTDNPILVREYVKVLSADGFNIGEKKLFQWFRENNYLNKKNEPYQQYVEKGYFHVIRRVISILGLSRSQPTTKITGKGQVYFAGKLKTQYNLDL